MVTIEIDDFFCGVGGGGTGAKRTKNGVINIKTAANHNPIATDLYQKNHEEAFVDCADLIDIPANRYQKGSQGAILSPDCTTFSDAFSTKELRDDDEHQQLVLDLYSDDEMTIKERQSRWDKMGEREKKDAILRSERSRLTPMQCHKFAQYMKWDFFIVENVLRFVTSWRLFQAWRKELEGLNYKSKIISFNSAATGTVPQSRDRVYIAFWRSDAPKDPNFDKRPECYCPKCETVVSGKQVFKKIGVTVGKYGRNGQYWYRCTTCYNIAFPLARAAKDIIDWSLPCPPIGSGDRLVQNTRNRIGEGLKKLGLQALMVNTHFSSSKGHIWHTNRPMPTQTTRQTLAVVTPPQAATGFIDENYTHGSTRSVEEPFSTFTTSGAHHGFVSVPEQSYFISSFYGRKDASSGINAPLPTTVVSPKHALVKSPFLFNYHGNSSNHSINAPATTFTTRDRLGLVMPDGSTLDLDDPKQLDQAISMSGFRMLIDKEVGKGSGFPEDYIVTQNNRTNIALFGQAITPDAVTWIFEAMIEALYC